MPRRTQKQQPSTAVVSTQPKFTKEKLRKFLLGSKEKEGFLKVFVIYALLICIGFIYIYPILYMVSQSFMTLDDLLDSSINWIPSKLNLDNYKQAAQSMDFWKSFGQSIIIAGVPTLCNLLSCSVIGYGLARFEFPGKKVVLGIILFTFILPSQITMIPTYVLYSNMGILGTIWSFVLPALLGMGINAPIFILIFWQFFRQVPKVLIEAAQIDGCTKTQATINVTIPLMRSSFVQCLFLTITRCFMVYDVNLSLTKGEPFNSSVMAAMHVYNQAFTYKNYGTGQAEALILFVVCAIVGVTQVYIGKKGEVAA